MTVKKINFSVISDTHLSHPPYIPGYKMYEHSFDWLKKAIVWSENNQMQAIFMPGDIYEAKYEVWENLKSTKEILGGSSLPVRIISGNHDLPHKSTREKFEKSDIKDNLGDWLLVDHPYSQDKFLFLGLDTSLDFSSYGELSHQELGGLEEKLKLAEEKKQIVILFMHHPGVPFHPVITLHSHMDVYLLKNYPDFLAMVEKYSCLKAVISGHTHAFRHAQMKHIHFISSPSLVSWPNLFLQFELSEKSLTVKTVDILNEDEKKKSLNFFTKDPLCLKNFSGVEEMLDYSLDQSLEGKVFLF